MITGSLHVAIIMDGNGRWALSRGLPRSIGHRAGLDSVRRVVEVGPALGIGTLTLFAFSSNNWQRPPDQVETLMDIFRGYLTEELDSFIANGVRINIMGRRDRLPLSLLGAMESAEAATSHGKALHLRIALDYSGREAILRAARRARAVYDISPETFSLLLAEVSGAGSPVPDIDLLIRTGGEQRLSDALLWESAYAELYFTATMWPDFSAADLETAVADFHGRDRRFGHVREAAAV